MFYTYTHPQNVTIIPQEDYNVLFAKILDKLGITHMSIASIKQMDILQKKEKISQILSESSIELADQIKENLVDTLFEGIFISLDGQNYADNQTGFTQIRSCSGQLQSVIEDYLSNNPNPISDLSIIGTLDKSDFDYIRSSLSYLRTLDLSDAIPKGLGSDDYYIIPDHALFREDGEMQLSELHLHDSTIKIGADAFRNCQKLEYVFMSKALKEIGPSAFAGCSILNKIVLPKSLSTIGDNAFATCPKLKSVLCLGEEPASLGDNSFTFLEDSRLVIPKGSLDSYSNSPWEDVFNSLFIDDTGDLDNYNRIRDARKNHIGFFQDEKRAVIRMMNAMSHSDNNPHISEEEIIYDTGVKIFDLTEEEVNMAENMDITEAVKVLLRMTIDKKDFLMNIVLSVAKADGGFTPGEKLLYKILESNLYSSGNN